MDNNNKQQELILSTITERYNINNRHLLNPFTEEIRYSNRIRKCSNNIIINRPIMNELIRFKVI